MIRLAASDHYPAEVYLPVLLIFIRSSTILHLVHRMFTSDMRKRTPSSGRVQELSQSEGGPWTRISPIRPESGSLRDEAIGDVEGPVERGEPEPEVVVRRIQRRDDVNPVEVRKRKHTVGLERGDDLVHLR